MNAILCSSVVNCFYLVKFIRILIFLQWNRWISKPLIMRFELEIEYLDSAKRGDYYKRVLFALDRGVNATETDGENQSTVCL
jgi:hypothetical protein